ncbi:hypothetical protein D3C81_1914410 [compost metagenome]
MSIVLLSIDLCWRLVGHSALRKNQKTAPGSGCSRQSTSDLDVALTHVDLRFGVDQSQLSPTQLAVVDRGEIDMAWAVRP